MSFLKMTRTIIVSSPGKLILAGEHSVVYGRRALVTSIGMRLYMRLIVEPSTSLSTGRSLTFTSCEMQTSHIVDPDQTDVSSWPLEQQAIQLVYQQFRDALSNWTNIRLDIRSEIPVGAGLGSSAAFSVCLVGCFSRLCHDRLDPTEINRLAYQVECLFHGTPSGIDNTISTFGQSLLYSRAKQEHLSFQLANLAIIDTGIPKSTKRMVAAVRQFAEQQPNEAEQIFSDIEQIVDAMATQRQPIDELIRRNQRCLVQMGVSLPAIDEIVHRLAQQGVACKITGAGGGGCLIALASLSMKDQLNTLLKEQTIRAIYFVQAGVDGLREEETF
jgi:mevalonate kinase